MVAVYFYTIHSVRQETFLEEIDAEMAAAAADAEAKGAQQQQRGAE